MSDLTFDEACELLASLQGRTIVGVGIEHDEDSDTHIIVLEFDDGRDLAVMHEEGDIAFVVDETREAPTQ